MYGGIEQVTTSDRHGGPGQARWPVRYGSNHTFPKSNTQLPAFAVFRENRGCAIVRAARGSRTLRLRSSPVPLWI